VNAWFLAARTARRLERMPDAERLLERCQQLGGVTDSTRLEWDLQRIQVGDLSGIDVRLRKSIDPDHPDALLVLEALVRGYLRVERLVDAKQACDLWMAHQPGHPWPWLWRGGIYERMQETDKALPDYQRAVQNAPEDREARLALGGLLLRQRRSSAAAEQYENILGRTPDDAAARLGLADCRIGEGRTAEAILLLDPLLEQSPTSPKASFLRGKVALGRDRPAEAECWLRDAVRLAPDDLEAHYLLSQALRAQHKEEEAIRSARKVDQLRKDHLRLHELIRTIARKSDDPRSRHEAGVIALRIGRSEEGLRQLHGALQLKGDHRATHAVLADYFRLKGDAERAETHRSLAEAPPR